MAAADAPALLPPDATWAAVAIGVIAGLFLAALVIGVVVRIVMPERFVGGEEKGHLHDENPEPEMADPDPKAL